MLVVCGEEHCKHEPICPLYMDNHVIGFTGEIKDFCYALIFCDGRERAVCSDPFKETHG